MTVNPVSEVQPAQTEPRGAQRIFPSKATQLVWLFLGLFEALLALRFFYKLIKAKPASPVGALFYAASGFFRLRVFQV
jgi:hypothetical protein